MCFSLVLLGGCDFTKIPTSEPFPKSQIEVASGLIRDLSESKFESALRCFHPELIERLPKETLEKDWNALTRNLGEYKGYKKLNAIDTVIDGTVLWIIVLSCEFESGDALIGIDVDEDSLVTNITFVENKR